MSSLASIRAFLQGKKAYITAVIGVLGAVAAWASGQITNMELLVAIWAAVSMIFIRSGVTTEVNRVVNGKEK